MLYLYFMISLKREVLSLARLPHDQPIVGYGPMLPLFTYSSSPYALSCSRVCASWSCKYRVHLNLAVQPTSGSSWFSTSAGGFVSAMILTNTTEDWDRFSRIFWDGFNFQVIMVGYAAGTGSRVCCTYIVAHWPLMLH